MDVVRLGISVAWLIVDIFLVIWTYRDAKRLHMDVGLWTLIVLLLGIIGFIIYCVLREDQSKPPVVYVPVVYYPLPAQAPPRPAPKKKGFVCPDCGNTIPNPDNSKSVMCDSCGSVHHIS